MVLEAALDASAGSHTDIDNVVLHDSWTKMKQRVYAAGAGRYKMYVCFREPLRTSLDESGRAGGHA